MSTGSQRIIVTGGAGFIGSSLIDKLLAAGHQVLCQDDLNDYYDPEIKKNNFRQHLKNKNYTLKVTDIRDLNAVLDDFKAFSPQIVIHLAARAGVRPSLENPFLYEAANVTGTLNLLQAAVNCGVEKFVFGSSSSVYGINSKVPFSEEDPLLKPISPYAATKIAGEALCHTYAHLYNLSVVVLRFFTVYGPRQRPDLAIIKFARLMRNGETIPVYGDGSMQRDYTFIDDITHGIIAAANYNDTPYEIINLGNNRTVSLAELISTLEKVLGVKAKIQYLPEQPGDVPLTYADVSKAARLLNFRPNTDLAAGLQAFADWLQNQAD